MVLEILNKRLTAHKSILFIVLSQLKLSDILDAHLKTFSVLPEIYIQNGQINNFYL